MPTVMKMLYRFKDLEPQLGIPLSDRVLREMERQGTFPRRLEISAGLTGWSGRQLEQWLSDREHAAEADAAKREAAAVARTKARKPRSTGAAVLSRNAQYHQRLADAAREKLASVQAGKAER